MLETSSLERALVWVGLVGAVLCFVGLAVADVLPPPSPNKTPDEVAAYYRDHINAFRVGTIIVGFGGALLMPWIAVVARRLHGIPGHGPVVSYCFLGMGLIVFYQIVMPISTAQATAFRADRSAEDMQTLSDLFFVQFVSPAYLYCVQLCVMAAAIFMDRSAVPAFPRWVGYVSLWVAAGSALSIMVIFFKTGPFAWNGIFGWWIPVSVFGMWMIAISAGFLKRPHGRALLGEPSLAGGVQ